MDFIIAQRYELVGLDATDEIAPAVNMFEEVRCATRRSIHTFKSVNMTSC